MEPIKYEDAEEANEVTFKDFIYKHIRKYLPAHYEGLVDDWDSVEKWGEIEYLREKIGDEQVYGIHYQGERPFRNFAGSNVFTNQRGHFMSFNEFSEIMLSKYDDKRISDPRDVSNIIH